MAKTPNTFKSPRKIARPQKKKVRREPGVWKGKVRIAQDFDAPLPPEIMKAFGA
jgi:hypothetical protein